MHLKMRQDIWHKHQVKAKYFQQPETEKQLKLDAGLEEVLRFQAYNAIFF